MDTKIEDAPRRSLAYWYDDGLAEIFVGVFFLLVAALFALEGLAPAGGLPASFSAFALPALVIGGMIVGGLGLRAVKERITYPRTGYVAYPRSRPARKWLAGILGGVISLLLVVFLANRPSMLVALPTLQGAAVAVILIVFAARSGVGRLAIQGLLALAAGLAAGFLGLQTWAGTALVFGIAGLASLAAGLVALAHYLRTAVPPSEGAG